MIDRLRTALAQAESLSHGAQERIAAQIEREAAGGAHGLSPEEVAALDWVIAQDHDGPEPTDEELLDWARSQADLKAKDVFTPEELAHIQRICEEPFVEASPEDMARLAAFRG